MPTTGTHGLPPTGCSLCSSASRTKQGATPLLPTSSNAFSHSSRAILMMADARKAWATGTVPALRSSNRYISCSLCLRNQRSISMICREKRWRLWGNLSPKCISTTSLSWISLTLKPRILLTSTSSFLTEHTSMMPLWRALRHISERNMIT